jgi:putative (di)nucleoside polyphosphate hydrolase
MDPKDLLIADLEHFGESLWKNEEIGEKRLSFFITVTTAVGGGLAALHARPGEAAQELFQATARAGLGALLILGLLGFLRMLHRNRVTDQYKDTLGSIRRVYADHCAGLAEYAVPTSARLGRRWLRGGYAETFAVMSGMLLVALLVLGWEASSRASGAAGLVLATGLVALSSRRSTSAKGKSSGPHFRAGVGAVIADRRGSVLAIERSDVRNAWQLVQGGLEKGEAPIDAALREIREETGIASDKLQLLDAYPEPLVYELPPDAQSARTGRGQVQYWFLFRFLGGDQDVRLPAEGESRAWRWMPLATVVSGAVAFRRRVYERLLERFDPVGEADPT